MTDESNNNVMLTVAEIASMWGIPQRTVYSWAAKSQKGELKKNPLRPGSYRRSVDGVWLIEYSAIEEKTRRGPDKGLNEVYEEREGKHGKHRHTPSST